MKKERLVLIVCVIMLFLSSIVNAMAVSAYLYNSNEVSYNNNSSGITSTNVQGAIDELYEHATDYNSMNTRVSALESHFNNSSVYAKQKSSDQNIAFSIKNTNNIERGALYFQQGGNQIVLHSANASGEWGKGVLNLVGNPVKINENIPTVSIAARSSSANLNTIYSNQPNDTIYAISAQSEQNQPIANSGAIHMVLSYRATAEWGIQWAFFGSEIFSRSMSNGTWGSWAKRL